MSVISINGLYKNYDTNTKKSLIHAILNKQDDVNKTKFSALSNITFNVKKGEAFAVIGRNGSGKSTLLQIIVGTLKQNLGTVNVNGRVSALLELGSGFNPEFTGIENIYLAGSILGISNNEMSKKIQEIEEFADIGSFIYQPVRTYSSGMLMRVAFAVAVAVEPDILIVDEALSVGDIIFQQKCNLRIKKLLNKGITLLVVTHDTSFVLNMCDRALWLHRGQQMYIGTATECVQRYLDAMSREVGNSSVGITDYKDNLFSSNYLTNINSLDLTKTKRIGDTCISITKLWIINKFKFSTLSYEVGDWCTIVIGVSTQQSLQYISAGCELCDRHGQVIFATGLRVIKQLIPSMEASEFKLIEIKIQLNLRPGQYTLDIGCGAGLGSDVKGSRYTAAAILEVSNSPENEVVHGIVRLPSEIQFLSS